MAPPDTFVLALPPPPPPPPPPTAGALSRQNILKQPRLDRVEDVNTYRPGGHHPVDLGDILVDRYRMIHKLGNGGFAIVWLARDLDERKNVALKILRDDASDREIQILTRLNNLPRSASIPRLYNNFMVRGPNGAHRCLVLDIGGPSCKQVNLYFRHLPLAFRSSAAKSLAEGVVVLHMAGVCHGDLTHSNVLFQVPGLREWSGDEIALNLGPPVTAPLRLFDGTPAPAFAPSRMVSALKYSSLELARISAEVLIIDFGEAFFKDNVPKGLGTPASFYSPEMLFGYRPSYAVDLWALGCLIFELVTSLQLIPTIFGTAEEALAMAIETIGALPEGWRNRCYKKDFIVEDDSCDKHRWFDSSLSRDRALSDQLRSHLPQHSVHQRATLFELLQSLVGFEPSNRLAASKIARHPWSQSSCGKERSGNHRKDRGIENEAEEERNSTLSTERAAVSNGS